jgi:hypothetical protein
MSPPSERSKEQDVMVSVYDVGTNGRHRHMH